MLYREEMWWLIGSASGYCGSGPGFESGISHSGETLRTGRVTVYTVKIAGQRGKPSPEAKKREKGELEDYRSKVNGGVRRCLE